MCSFEGTNNKQIFYRKNSNNNDQKLLRKVENQSQSFKFIIRVSEKCFKGTVIQIEKGLITDCLCVSKVSLKFCIPVVYNSAVIYP